ncbi:MAG: THUMP domain-containing protein [Gammaproteobacteria bacterium]
MISDWNVVATVQEHRFRRAWEFLQAYGAVARTDYFNVITLRVAETGEFLERLRRDLTADAAAAAALARVVPVTTAFGFQTPEEFEAAARRAVTPWLSELAGCTFHVRMHRRGFKGRLSSQDEERFLDRYVIEGLLRRGADASVSFDDPDIIIAVETVGQRGGVSRWAREPRRRYPFLGLD